MVEVTRAVAVSNIGVFPYKHRRPDADPADWVRPLGFVR